MDWGARPGPGAQRDAMGMAGADPRAAFFATVFARGDEKERGRRGNDLKDKDFRHFGGELRPPIPNRFCVAAGPSDFVFLCLLRAPGRRKWPAGVDCSFDRRLKAEGQQVTLVFHVEQSVIRTNEANCNDAGEEKESST